jgi:hypothetical protein
VCHLRTALPLVLFENGERALVELLRLCVVALLAREIRQATQRFRQQGMSVSQGLLANGARTLIERLGLLIATAFVGEDRQAKQRIGYLGMLGSYCLFLDMHGSLVQELCLLVLALPGVEFR